MTQYLVAIHHPDDYDPSAEDEGMCRDIDALNDEMVAAGVRIFDLVFNIPAQATFLASETVSNSDNPQLPAEVKVMLMSAS